MVADGKEPVLISRASRPMAVLIPADEYEEYERRVGGLETRRRAAESMDRLRTRLGSRGRNVDVVRMIRSMRDSR
jgi:PHD/YefM family antitoxin component YafN of YafNO toxin-antitoxin module